MESSKFDFPKVFTEVCQGNQDAVEFCLTFLEWVHLVDDFIDQDKPLNDPELVMRVNLRLAVVAATNPFFQRYKAQLLPVMVAGVKAYADSLEWMGRKNAQDRQASEVLKSNYQEVFWYVAFLIGGWGHMDATTKKFRHYNYDLVSQHS
jgi:hypothetical protein